MFFSLIKNGQIPFTDQTVRPQYLGAVILEQLKAKDKTKIEETKADLIERLKEIGGPCLSFDAPELFFQNNRLYEDASELIQKYGDILLNPVWRTRLFRLDP